mgnify:CR=1 FL=1
MNKRGQNSKRSVKKSTEESSNLQDSYSINITPVQNSRQLHPNKFKIPVTSRLNKSHYKSQTERLDRSIEKITLKLEKLHSFRESLEELELSTSESSQSSFSRSPVTSSRNESPLPALDHPKCKEHPSRFMSKGEIQKYIGIKKKAPFKPAELSDLEIERQAQERFDSVFM